MTDRTTLDDRHREQLSASAIAPEVIIERGYQTVRSTHDVHALAPGLWSTKTIGQMLHGAALLLPIYRLGAAKPYTYVLRPDEPRRDMRGKPIKYEWPRGVPLVFDTLPRYAEAVRDPRVPLAMIEGVKKTDAVATAYGERLLPITMNGVWGWRGENKYGGKTALDDIDSIAWEGRDVWLMPDGDVRVNPQVLAAVQRLARHLTGKYKVGSVRALHLPMGADGAKIGIDDYLAAGHTTDEIESQLVTLDTLSQPRVLLGTHPETHKLLYLPPGYDVRDHELVYTAGRGENKRLYPGLIYVRDTGEDLRTHAQQITVVWRGAKQAPRERTIPYRALTDGRLFSAELGSQGVGIGPATLKDVQQYLVEFDHANVDALPQRKLVDQLGLVEGGVVLPAGAVGFEGDVRYTGSPISVGSDADAYVQALQTACGWDAPLLWLVLTLSLAAPCMARMALRRNPVLYISGESGSGKTTIAQFATGCFGNPETAPFLINAPRSTVPGVFQTLDGLHGLPCLLDEAHMISEPTMLEKACYAFANGQRYTVGSPDGKAKGGGVLHGALLLSGEAMVEFANSGSRLRVLWANADQYRPLGAPERSPEGGARAAVLEAAWKAGAGLFGLKVLETVWRDWAAFTADVGTMEGDEQLRTLGAWRTPLATAAAMIQVIARVAPLTHKHVPDVGAWFGGLLETWAAMLTSGHETTDPATAAFDALKTLLAQGRRRNNSEMDSETNGYIPPTWEWIEADHGGGVIAVKKSGDGYWRVPTSTPQFIERVGSRTVQLHGKTWLKRGWVELGRGEKTTGNERLHTGESLPCLRVPYSALSAIDHEEEEEA